MNELDLCVVGGGAAGFFAAVQFAALAPEARVEILEAGGSTLQKVKVSGGGRCNVTHACFDLVQFSRNYPRGERQMKGLLRHFGPQDTIDWFKARGVELHTESDGRMFPTTNSSSTIIDCLQKEARSLGVVVSTRNAVTSISMDEPASTHPFVISCGRSKRTVQARKVILATGSSKRGYELARGLGHTITELAPSLFTFVIKDQKLRALSGVSFQKVRARLSVPGKKRPFEAEGPFLVTHWGVSGPAVLRISAFAAEALQASEYRATLRVNFTPEFTVDSLRSHLSTIQKANSGKLIEATPLAGISKRFWNYLLTRVGCVQQRWSEVGGRTLHALAEMVTSAEFEVDGKGVFKEEFVTCGGIPHREVSFSSLQSKLVEGLYFCGEVLNIDGVTGGFNFQNAWSTATVAARDAAQTGI